MVATYSTFFFLHLHGGNGSLACCIFLHMESENGSKGRQLMHFEHPREWKEKETPLSIPDPRRYFERECISNHHLPSLVSSILKVLQINSTTTYTTAHYFLHNGYERKDEDCIFFLHQKLLHDEYFHHQHLSSSHLWVRHRWVSLGQSLMATEDKCLASLHATGSEVQRTTEKFPAKH